MSSFAERLRALRRENGWTQKELADRLRLKRPAVTLYETGRREPDYGTLQKIAEVLQVSVDYLLGRTEVRGLVETAATSRSDGYDKKLPPEALKSIEDFKEFIRRKYGPKKDKGQDEK